jgi:putative autoinducer-2 (AI-2) aldolase
MLAEFGVQIVKVYYCDNFEAITAACPVPIVIAGGKKVPEHEALEITYQAIQKGAAGVDMGRNVFQADNPAAMIQSIRKVVHEKFTGAEAFEFYTDLSSH